MFGVDDRLERDGAEAARDGRVEVGPDVLLMLKVSGLDVLGGNGRGLGIGVVLVHGG